MDITFFGTKIVTFQRLYSLASLKSIKQTYSHFHHIGKLWQNFQLRVALNLNLELCETFYFLWLTSTFGKVIEPKSAVDEEGDKIDSLDAAFFALLTKVD